MKDNASSLDFQIHKATFNDMKIVCDILGNAFSNDPVLSWVIQGHYSKREIFRYEAESLYQHHNQVYINQSQTGAALWLPAGIDANTPFLHWRFFSVAWQLLKTGGYQSLLRALHLQEVLVANHPKTAHFYLHAVGTLMKQQGKGIGSALLKAGLAACDQQGMPAYLESTNEQNNPLYQRYGFKITKEISLKNNGPTLWLMWREAN